MNANTRLRLWKETRALLPMWAGVSALMVIPFLLASDLNQIGLATFAYVFGCAVLGPVCVGQEFQHRTMPGLLSQPVSRRRIWWEKLAVSGAAFAMLTILLLMLAWFHLRRSGFADGYWHEAWLYVEQGADTLTGRLWRYIVFFQKSAEFYLLFALTSLGQSLGFLKVDLYAYRGMRWTPELVSVAASFFVPPLLGFCTGPTCTLFARSALGGAALTFLGPWALLLSGILLFEAFGGGVSGPDESVMLLYYALFIGSLYAAAMFLLGCRRFARLEDVNLLAQEFAAPRQFDSLFARLTAVLAPGRDSQLANLLRKEVRLQRPAVFVAVFLVALWLTFIVARRVHPALGAEVLMVPSILLALGVPVIAGIVAVAEERSLGVHEWHLTLPVSARRQWGVKVLVAFSVNVAFGLLLPGLLAHASSWLASDPRLVAEIPGSKVPHFLVANAVIFCAALYASTASANTMRALVGAIAVLVTAFSVILWWPGPQIFRVAENNWATAGHLLTGSKIEGASTSLLWGLGAVVTCLISLQVVAAKLFIQQGLTHPLTNFRWRPDSSLVPVRQMVALTSVLVGLLLLSLGVIECVDYFWSSAYGQRTSP